MNFVDVLGGWVNRYFSRPDAIFLIAAILVLSLVLYTLAGALAPVLTGLILAFLLQGLVGRLERFGSPRLLAIIVAMIILIGTVSTAVLLVVPLLWQQAADLLALAPSLIGMLRDALSSLSEAFPEFITEEQIRGVVNESSKELGNLSAFLLESAFSQVFSLFGLLIYLVLVPISVFFLLKDKELLMTHMNSLLPKDRPLLDTVGSEMNAQLGNYVRGKVIEILLVGTVTFVTFLFFGLNYAALLGVLVGISVLIPFIGAAIVTLPVFMIAVLQFGWSFDLAWVMLAYGVIQFLDGNVLVPLLFSEAVDLHPITIIVAILAFGGLWGLWGVFFAIPLATLIKAIYVAWPRAPLDGEVLEAS
ncbi:MAG: AI-2E family transporter [Pseudomonadota bacterium]|nr:AI-2E family transporter [Pseudomonadota bacterium]|tara:strand:- start:634 stop:1716 length:1083 start_codon:yes stop_codon:yes gene_type:complete